MMKTYAHIQSESLLVQELLNFIFLNYWYMTNLNEDCSMLISSTNIMQNSESQRNFSNNYFSCVIFFVLEKIKRACFLGTFILIWIFNYLLVQWIFSLKQWLDITILPPSFMRYFIVMVTWTSLSKKFYRLINKFPAFLRPSLFIYLFVHLFPLYIYICLPL